MTQQSTGQPAGEAGATRSVGELLLTFLAGSVLLPVFQGMTSRAGEDLYAWVRGLFPGKKAEAAEERLMNDGQISLVDPVRRMIFELPADLTDREAAAILSLRLPTAADTWLLIRKDYARRMWLIEPADAPPEEGIETTAAEEPPQAGLEA